MNIEEAYAYLRYKNLKIGWNDNVIEYDVSRVVQVPLGWIIEINYTDHIYEYDDDNGAIRSGRKEEFIKSIHVDISDFNKWRSFDRNNKLNNLGINDEDRTN